MQNNKNLLQEYCQKKHLALPEYEPIYIGMIGNNQQQWRSEVTLYDGTKYLSDIMLSKKAAESSAANKALNDINKIIYKKKIAIMIDIENLHNFHKSIPDQDYDFFDVYIFVGKHHHLVDEIFHQKAIKIISPSTRPDGTDSCMQVFVGSCLAKELYHLYFIASRDKFASNLVEMITNNNLGWKNQKAYVITKYEQTSEHL